MNTLSVKRTFLDAQWRKLVMINYAIDPEILKSYVPFNTELDIWEGNCYVSLIGFMFVDTKMLRLRIPFHINFEEINLRFYVKHKATMGTRGEWYLLKKLFRALR